MRFSSIHNTHNLFQIFKLNKASGAVSMRCCNHRLFTVVSSVQNETYHYRKVLLRWKINPSLNRSCSVVQVFFWIVVRFDDSMGDTIMMIVWRNLCLNFNFFRLFKKQKVLLTALKTCNLHCVNVKSPNLINRDSIQKKWIEYEMKTLFFHHFIRWMSSRRAKK